jgi:hypothetical protein
MKTFAPYLLHQLVRFGALTIPQLLVLCTGKAARSSLYRVLNELIDTRCIIPVLHPTKRIRCYVPTPLGVSIALGESRPRAVGFRLNDLEHTVMAAQVLMRLSQHGYVSGVATQYEIDPDDIKQFCHHRIPDGILELTRGGHRFELAVEVETTLRNKLRISEVIERYDQSFKRGLSCSGLIVVSNTPAIHAAYEAALAKCSKPTEEKVLLLLGPELRDLNPQYFGQYNEGPSPSWEKTRSLSQDQAEYVPLNSIGYESYLTQHSPDLEAEAAIRRQEFL